MTTLLPSMVSLGISLPRELLSHGLQSARLLCPWDSPGNSTGESCHASSRGPSPPGDRTRLLCFLHCGWSLHLQIHQRSPAQAQGGEDSISSDALSFYDWTGTGKLASVTLLFQATNSDQRPSSMTITL